MPALPQCDQPLLERQQIAYRHKAAITAMTVLILELGMIVFLDIASVVGALRQPRGYVVSSSLRRNDNAPVSIAVVRLVTNRAPEDPFAAAIAHAGLEVVHG